MNIKTATYSLLALIATTAACAVPVTVTLTGTITESSIGTSTNPFLLNAIGQSWTYSFNFDTIANPETITGGDYQYTYGFYSSAGSAATLTIGTYNFTPPNDAVYRNDIIVSKDSLYLEDALSFETNDLYTPFFLHGLLFQANAGDGWGGGFVDRTRTAISGTQSFDGLGNPTVDFVTGKTPAQFEGGGFYLRAFEFGNGVVTLTGEATTMTFSNIPEPSAFAAIAGVGVLVLSATRRRRR